MNRLPLVSLVSIVSIVPLAVALVVLPGCQADDAMHDHSMMQAGASAKTAVATIKPSTAATTRPSMNNVTGTVTFTEMPGNKVRVVANLSGLTPNTTHGFHIHESGDMSAPDLTSTGGHYNPQGHPHAAPSAAQSHAGDMGNITSNAQGQATLDMTLNNVTLGGATNSIVGKAVIVHAQPDDLTSQPAGNAGARIAGGVIELKQ